MACLALSPPGTAQAGTDIAGYACRFEVIDLGRDIIERGAFAAGLALRGPGAVRMLYQHDPAAPIGVWTHIVEDARGLYVRGRLAGDVERAREVASLIRLGALDGLSIGFKAAAARTDPRTRVRRISRIDLWEISIVTFPMQPDARVIAAPGPDAMRARPIAGRLPA
ncbi:HK97 family phage prohead protease [Xanthobacter sp. DSM 24535]|uniref:HK97 family phage prohead protease n=1 Tax=Roseixanthobacter psychrophilus TaxID=3119917 RepID=UPI003726DDE2